MSKGPPRAWRLLDHMATCPTCAMGMTLSPQRLCNEAAELEEAFRQEQAAFVEGGGEVFSRAYAELIQHRTRCAQCAASGGQPALFCDEGVRLFELARDDAAARGETMTVPIGTD